ncbi:lipopolysaccharide heptosyltransferase II [Pantoea sp. Mhis]|uniref:lipopolysaccharide heptosyltransferase II n=1 Tax=Pantoea sp. Mhis TaxID=2576759 RepID=UPI0013572EA6|nr:lipopolysaccharide heptosyltransferase II [Pantoea sp. Mhis]MXP56650.1 lipopolysaccharide heptosyltransferase II [Pantoea sp. Mhis]
MKILIIGPSWIGDMVMSQSLYRTIKKNYTHSVIDVIAPIWCCSLLSYMPEVNQALIMPFDHGILAFNKRYQLSKILQLNNYDRSYILPNSFKSALIPFFAGIQHRIGWRGEMRYGLINDMRILDKTAFPLMVERYIALAYEKTFISAKQLPKPLMWPKLKINEEEKRKIKSKFVFLSIRPIICLCPGAALSLEKCWPHYHYAALAEKLIKEGYQIILIGSKEDHKICNNIIQLLSNSARIFCKNLAGKTQLTQALILLTQCIVVISNDSGLMHAAAALNCRLVVLYGPSSPIFTPPLSHQARIIRMDENCYKIYKNHINKDGYHHSLIDIEPIHVYKELMILLNSSKNLI